MLKSIQKGFTLIELIIVITILVLLGVVVVVLIDPAEILAQSRDSQRISDLASLKGATQLTLAAGVPSTSFCYSTNPPETTSNATSTNADTSQIFSSLTAGLTTGSGSPGYNWTASTTAQSVTGTGWIQINYTTPSTGRALSNLPIDPTNTLASGYFYRWGCNYNGSLYQYEVDARLESAKYKAGCTASGCDDKASKDGGNSSVRYEAGNNLNVLPLAP